MPIKVYDLAKEYKMTNTEMQNLLGKLGFPRLSPASDLTDEAVTKVRTSLGSDGASAANGNGDGAAAVPTAARGANGGPSGRSAGPRPPLPGGGGSAATGAAAAAASADPAPSGEAVEVPENISVKELADRLGVPAAEIQKVLMNLGVLAALNQRLAGSAVQRIAQKIGRSVRIATSDSGSAPAAAAPAASAAAAPAAPAPVAPRTGGAAGSAAGGATVTPGRKTVVRQAAPGAGKGRAGQQALAPRPPVVTIMGHVDHGKTTLLDAIRKTAVAEGEAGGITQHIGAYQVEANGKRITFLDTPGHAAFSQMRARGARVTDIVVIVVAADDGVMPQTEEAIKHARDAGVPMVVAINKTDLPDANPDRVMTDLTQYEIVPEAYGGETQTVNISAKTGEGISDLLDTLLLVSEVEVDPKADLHGKAQGTVIEAKLEKGRGAVVSVLVQQGTLRRGDIVVAGEHYGKIRAMTDDRGNEVKVAGPSMPVEIVGFASVPIPGDRLEVVDSEKEARAIADRREERARDERLNTRSTVTLEALYRQLREGAAKELNVVIKGDVQGTVQAVRDSLEQLGNEEVKVRILQTGIGPISDGDILLVSSDKEADESNSLVVGFNVGIAPGVERRAEQEHVRIRTFTIIYELIDFVKAAMVDLLEPIYEEAALGRAEVRARFRLPGGRAIAGCYVVDGIIRRNAQARLRRGDDVLFTGAIDSLKRIKEDVREVSTGYECGLTLRDFNDIAEGDTIECFEIRQIPREL